MALMAVVVVAGFYVRARMEMRSAMKNLPGKLGIEIQQTSEGFSLSKSDGGRTLFTIHASKATQFKAGGRAELHDVNIVVYGRKSDRFDQIYGSDFEYDQKAGNGDLQRRGSHRPGGQYGWAEARRPGNAAR